MKLLKKIVKHEDGQVLVLVALLMVVLVGFAALLIDVGAMYLTKTNMQNAADAAALAGAQKLPDRITAESTAKDYAEFNGADRSKTIVDTQYGGDPTMIKVVITKNVQYSFAKVLGLINGNVSASAVAQKVANLPSEFTDYAIFSESENTALSVGKNNATITGTIHTNNALNLGMNDVITRVEAHDVINEKKPDKNVIGTRLPYYPIIKIPGWFKTALLAQVKLAPKKDPGDPIFRGDTLDLSQSVYVDGAVTITSQNIIGNGFIYATGDINITGNNGKFGSDGKPVFIYSGGNITIDGNGNNITMYGIIYAPTGEINVKKNNWNLHGSLIGNTFADCLKNNPDITAGSEYFSGVPIGGWTSGLVE